MSIDAEAWGGFGHAEELDPIEAGNHFFDFLDEQARLRAEAGGCGSNPDTDPGIDPGTDTGNDAVQAEKGPKPKRAWKPNKLGTRKIVVTAMHEGKFEPSEPEDARACYDNQLGCILRETASINDVNL
jgi:hypothetical protein